MRSKRNFLVGEGGICMCAAARAITTSASQQISDPRWLLGRSQWQRGREVLDDDELGGVGGRKLDGIFETMRFVLMVLLVGGGGHVM